MTDIINIAIDFTKFPGGRYPQDGEGNGTSFREKFLLPVLKANKTAEVILDGALGYPSSFLEEAFGGLVRTDGYSPEKVLATFTFIAKQPGFQRFVKLIESYVRGAVVTPSVA
ncbi:STAS-like domain-containing protein [Pseudorhodobacter wandonensis]|jgi:hypothetical protein|uniref:STAS-like domain-containing protein n=1 Tax=Pseudorhodobacter wandonensis TaxID=1120568 RepID=UPI0009E2D6B0|nr:STAS-like domain-containing protein [Pseudorhodobacter wandonensis]